MLNRESICICVRDNQYSNGDVAVIQYTMKILIIFESRSCLESCEDSDITMKRKLWLHPSTESFNQQRVSAKSSCLRKRNILRVRTV